jgi:hypothetical protein
MREKSRNRTVPHAFLFKPACAKNRAEAGKYNGRFLGGITRQNLKTGGAEASARTP